MKTHIYICAGIALLSLTRLDAQTTLSLTEARQIALERNAQVGIATATSEGAKEKLREMHSNYLPKLSVSALAYYSFKKQERTLQVPSITLAPQLLGQLQSLATAMPQLAPILAPLASGSLQIPPISYSYQLGPSYYASLTLTQPIYMGGKISTANRMAKIGVEMAKQNERKVRADLILELDKAYWLVVETQELRKTALSYRTTLEEVLRIVQNAVAAGMRTKADLLRVEMELSNAELQLTKANNGLNLAQKNLAQVLAMPLDTQFNLQTALDSLSKAVELESTILPENASLSTRPEMALLDSKVAMSHEQVRLIRSESLPQLGLRASYSYINGLHFNDRKLFDSFTPSVMLSLNVPIWNWGEGRAKIRKAKTDELIARLEQTQLSEKMRLEQAKAYNDYSEQKITVDIMRRSLAHADELLRQTMNRYQAGLDTTAEYLQVHTLRTKASSDLIRALAELALARTALDKALGLL